MLGVMDRVVHPAWRKFEWLGSLKPLFCPARMYTASPLRGRKYEIWQEVLSFDTLYFGQAPHGADQGMDMPGMAILNCSER